MNSEQIIIKKFRLSLRTTTLATLHKYIQEQFVLHPNDYSLIPADCPSGECQKNTLPISSFQNLIESEYSLITSSSILNRVPVTFKYESQVAKIPLNQYVSHSEVCHYVFNVFNLKTIEDNIKSISFLYNVNDTPVIINTNSRRFFPEYNITFSSNEVHNCIVKVNSLKQNQELSSTSFLSSQLSQLEKENKELKTTLAQAQTLLQIRAEAKLGLQQHIEKLVKDHQKEIDELNEKMQKEREEYEQLSKDSLSTLQEQQKEIQDLKIELNKIKIKYEEKLEAKRTKVRYHKRINQAQLNIMKKKKEKLLDAKKTIKLLLNNK